MMRLGNWAMRSAASLDLTTFPGHDDAERARTHAIVEWRIHHLHFAIERHRQPACLGANLQLLQAEAFDVARLANLAENHAADHPEEAERPALLDHIDRDLAAIGAEGLFYSFSNDEQHLTTLSGAAFLFHDHPDMTVVRGRLTYYFNPGY